MHTSAVDADREPATDVWACRTNVNLAILCVLSAGRPAWWSISLAGIVSELTVILDPGRYLTF